MSKHIRPTISAVMVLIQFEDLFLFEKRPEDKKVDPGMLHPIGGKLENGENFVDAAIRETYEESGHRVVEEDLHFLGLVRIQGGYEMDFMTAFFRYKVGTQDVTVLEGEEVGEMNWYTREELLGMKGKMVDDVYQCIDRLVDDKAQPFFGSFTYADGDEGSQVIDSSVSPSA